MMMMMMMIMMVVIVIAIILVNRSRLAAAGCTGMPAVDSPQSTALDSVAAPLQVAARFAVNRRGLTADTSVFPHRLRGGLREGVAVFSFILTLLSLLQPIPAFGVSPRKSVADGVKHYNKEEFDQALTEFLAALEKSSERPEIRYDLGTALYKLQQYPQAAEALSKAAVAKNPRIAGDAWFNLGNAMFNAQKLDEAVGAYKQALKLNHKDEDAKHNLELALRMKQIQQQQPQPSQSDSTQQQKQQQQQQQKQQQEQKEQEQQQQQAQQAQTDSTRQDSSQSQPQIQRGPMSREEAEKLLQALEQDEQDAQKEKIRRMMGEPRRAEKDW